MRESEQEHSGPFGPLGNRDFSSHHARGFYPTAAVSAASSAAPARSVSRRAVSALSGTRVQCASTAGTRSNGSHVPSRTMLACTNGE